MARKVSLKTKKKIFLKLLPALLRDAEREAGIRAGEMELIYFDKKKLKRVL
jgi:hypothetical protein